MAVAPLFMRRNALRLLRPAGYQGASFGAPSPLKRGRSPKSPTARRRENKKPWLFEI
jgi:hypothetical protein